jgi:predicted metalloprotease with PDZ domain
VLATGHVGLLPVLLAVVVAVSPARLGAQAAGRADSGFASLAVHPAQPATQQRVGTLRYEVHVGNPADHVFDLTLKIPAGRGTLTLHLPATTPGDMGLKQHARYIDHFRATGERGRALRYERVAAQSWKVEVPSPSEVVVTYRIHMNERDILRLGTNGLGLHGGFLEGSSVFLYVDDHMDDPVEVSYLIPENWTVVMLLPANQERVFTADGYRTLVDAPAQFGDMRERDIPVDDFKVRLVFDQPLPPYDSVAFDANVRAIMRQQTALFGSRPFSGYTIFIHWRPDLDYGGGIEHGRAMVLNVGSKWMIDLPRNAAGTIAHEIFHAWNGEAFYPTELNRWDFAGPNYSPHLWFVEGVTSYFASLTLIRSRILSADQFFEMMSRSITEYENDAGRGWSSLAESGIAAWISSPDALDYYGGGEVTGFLLDLALRLETDGQRGLDDVLRSLYKQSRNAGYGGYNDSQLRASVSAIAGHEMNAFFDRYVTGRDSIDYASMLGRTGLRFSRTHDPEGRVRIVIAPLEHQTPLQARIWSKILH